MAKDRILTVRATLVDVNIEDGTTLIHPGLETFVLGMSQQLSHRTRRSMMFRYSACFSMVIILAHSVWMADANAQGRKEGYANDDRRIELASHQNCHVWGVDASPDEVVTWNANCADGLADGFGTLTWFRESAEGDTTRVQTGLLRGGRKQGQWFEQMGKGYGLRIETGPYDMGKKHGQWFEQSGKDYGLRIEIGPYDMGKKHGQWFEQSGKDYGLRIETGPYGMGKRHGQWFEQSGKGNGLRIETGSYDMGKKHGRWFEQLGNGNTLRTETDFYEMGKKHGP